MSKTIVSRFDKHLISSLPKAAFDGRIIVIQSESEANKAVDYLLSHSILGFDTETRPTFKKGHRRLVALLQVSTYDTCFLFRLDRIGMPDSILRLLTDETVRKIGLSWHDDINSLCRRKQFECAPFVELQDYAKELGIQDMSLQKLYANLFGQKISKNQQLSNWEAETYSDAQKLYAATDAWACIQIYEELQRLQQTGDYVLEVIPEPEPVPRAEKTEESEPKAKKKPRKKRKKVTKPKGEHMDVAQGDKTNDDSSVTGRTEKRRKYNHKRKPKANVQDSTSQEG